MAPWDASAMKKKGAKRMPFKAAKMANAILANSDNEGMAIATALKYVNKAKAGKGKKRMFPG